MKKAAIILGTLAIPTLAFAQGSLFFNNYVPTKDTANKLPIVNAPVFVDSIASGVKCDGNNYYIAIFGGTVGTAPAAMVSATWGAANTNVVKAFNTGTGAGYLKTGQNVQWNSLAVGSMANVQVRAWSASLGTTYEAALAAYTANPLAGKMGASEVLTIKLTDMSLPVQPRLGSDADPAYALNSANPGLASFAVTSIPEPSVVALAGLGLVGAFMIRRRK